ncbi:hypothetical protein STCU_11918 [Strigomonas culicis]|uniref:Uncharacterized protein n=1 Tax=Strigomonas culicis TaxID=28005 RepID=S9TGX8_9TRYP|nr:hypothetical protein STCU_11918 [Strigomonas culicis]|eukprot:EPY15578.1 hypothetical protein STCU_11918 [Strigomonas culicis]
MRSATRTRASQPQLAAPTLPPLPQKGERRRAHRRNTLQSSTAACGDPCSYTSASGRSTGKRTAPVNAKHPRAPSVKGWRGNPESYMRRLSQSSYYGGSVQRQGNADGALAQIAALEAEDDKNVNEETESEAAMPVVSCVRDGAWSCVRPQEIGARRTEPSATDTQGEDMATGNPFEPRGRRGSQPPSQPQEQEHGPMDSTTAAWSAPDVVAATAAVTHVTAPQQHRFIPAPPPRRKSSVRGTVSFQRQSFLSRKRSGAIGLPCDEAGVRAVDGDSEPAACEGYTMCRTPRLFPRHKEKYKRCKPTPLSVDMLLSES